MRRTEVGDVMTTNVVTVPEEAGFKDIVRTLGETGVSGAPVVGAHGRVLGVVSETDLLRKEEFKDPTDTPRPFFEPRARRIARTVAAGDTAAELMSSPPVTVSPTTSVVEAARLLARAGVNRLPVVDDAGRLVGIVSRSDLLRVFLQSDEEIKRRVIDDVFVRALWEDPARVVVDVRDGVVHLAGKVETRTTKEIAVRLVRALDSVVDVEDHLNYLMDDTATSSVRLRP